MNSAAAGRRSRTTARSRGRARASAVAPHPPASSAPGELAAVQPDAPPVAASLEPSKALFIRRWGEMGSYWGISRTMAEIHALLYVSTAPVCTDDVMRLLAVSRGNASMNLRSLVDWGLIQRVHIRGDRKEYFTALTDVWQMFETILRQRRRREVEPILDTLRRCRTMAGTEVEGLPDNSQPDARAYLKRLDDLNQFLTAVGTMADLLLSIGPRGLDEVSRLAARWPRP